MNKMKSKYTFKKEWIKGLRPFKIFTPSLIGRGQGVGEKNTYFCSSCVS